MLSETARIECPSTFQPPQVSQATACNTSALVQLSNAEKSHERLQQLLPLYFYSWNLTDAHSIIVFLLLHYFLLRREHKEALGAKGLYEEHIELLKSRMSDLEAKLSNSQSSPQSDFSSRIRKADGSQSTGQDRQVVEIQRLMGVVESLRRENDQLQLANEELCRINNQWALDYQSLSDKVKNATGCYSVQSNSSSGHSSARASPVPYSMQQLPCLQCSQRELQLEAKREEIKVFQRKLEDLRGEMRKIEVLLERRDRDVQRLTSENSAILLQVSVGVCKTTCVKFTWEYVCM